MLLIVAALMVVLWALGFLVVHVSTAAIHLVLVVAVLAVIAHVVRGTSRGIPQRH